MTTTAAPPDEKVENAWRALLANACRKGKSPDSTVLFVGNASVGKRSVLNCYESKPSKTRAPLRNALSYRYTFAVESAPRHADSGSLLRFIDVHHPEDKDQCGVISVFEIFVLFFFS